MRPLCVYFSWSRLRNYCTSISPDPGYVCEEHNNPPDFFLDILHGVVLPTASPDLMENGDLAITEKGENSIYTDHL